MNDLSLYTMSELSALRFGISLAVKEIQKTKETCELNPCFTSNAKQALLQCIQALDFYAAMQNWKLINNFYERR